MDDTNYALMSAMARSVIHAGDTYALLRMIEDICKKANIDYDARTVYRMYRKDAWHRKLIEVEKTQPRLAAILQEHIDEAIKMAGEES